MAAPFRTACLRRSGIYNSLNFGCKGCSSLRVLITTTRNGSQKKQEDFFGIEEHQRHVNTAEPMSSTTREKEIRKLLRPLSKKKKNSEVVVQALFGQVRLDSDARKTYVGDLSPKSILQTVAEAGGNFKLEDSSATAPQNAQFAHDDTTQRLKSTAHPQAFTDSFKKDENEPKYNKWSAPEQQETNYFDEQYFGQQLQTQRPKHHTRDHRIGDGALEGRPEQKGNPDQVVNYSNSATDYRSGSVADTVSENQSTDNYIDQFYFPTLTHTAESSKNSSSVKENDCQNHGSFIDQQYFTHHIDSREHPAIKNRSATVDININTVKVGVHSEEQVIHQNHSIKQDSHFDSDVNFDSEHSFEFGQSETNSRNQVGVQCSVSADPKAEAANRASFEDHVSFVDAQYFDSHVSGQNTSPFDSIVKQYGVTDSDTMTDLQVKQLEIDNKISDFTTPSHHEIHEANVWTSSMVGSSSQSSELEHRDLKGATAKESVVIPGTVSDLANQAVPAIMPALKKQQRSTEQETGHRKKGVDFASKREIKTGDNEPDSAYNVAMKLRKNLRLNLTDTAVKTLPRDKQRLLSYKERLPDLEHMPAREVAQLLADNIIFENDDFIAIDKPYGLPSHGGPDVRVSVGQVLQQLGGHVDKGRQQLDSLHLIHRLDKETTGVMLLAKNAEVAWQLLGMFRRREVGKTYWTVTKGLPKPLEGVIEIPLMRQRVGKIYKTVIQPKQYLSGDRVKTQTWSRRDDRSQEAVTQYQVLAHRDSMALVECRPLTGVQHQIRTHLAQALNTPVLGDHKYSHIDRLAPQKLFPEALQKLGIRQAQVRHLPMHLHAKALVLPEWRGRTNVFIKANVPRFFLRSLKALKIKIPSK